jgi:ubiquinone/menaquinone biosynthesis C-methylase UbiE
MKQIFRTLGFRIWYWYVNRIDKKAEVLLMNYGYADTALSITLEPQDESDRYSIQLYHYVAGAINLENKAITEIGCGRGGGLVHIVKNFSPASARGLDLDNQAITFCKRHYAIKELSFLQGDAQKMPLDNDTCDVVINVESSHRYPDMKLFLNEVYRILRDDGYFLFTDFRNDYEIAVLQKELQSCGMKILKEELITPQVVSALELDDGRRRQLVEKLTPGFLHKTALNFAGAVSSETYNRFVARKYVYFNYILQKI